MKRKRAIGVATVGASIVAVALLTGGATSPQAPPPPFEPALNAPITGPAATPTQAEPPAGRGTWFLSPTESHLGRAVRAALGSQVGPGVVQSSRNETYNKALSRQDVADLRGRDGSGYEIDWWLQFAQWELDDNAQQQRADSGIYWVGGTGEDIQSVYYLSDRGYALWVGHYSAKRGDQVSVDALLTIAERIAANLEAGGAPRVERLQREATP